MAEPKPMHLSRNRDTTLKVVSIWQNEAAGAMNRTVSRLAEINHVSGPRAAVIEARGSYHAALAHLQSALGPEATLALLASDVAAMERRIALDTVVTGRRR